MNGIPGLIWGCVNPYFFIYLDAWAPSPPKRVACFVSRGVFIEFCLVSLERAILHHLCDNLDYLCEMFV